MDPMADTPVRTSYASGNRCHSWEKFMRMVQSVAAAAAASSLLLLAACGSDDASAAGAAGSSSSSSDGVSVVASTNVYGDFVSAIAGDDVEVTSITGALEPLASTSVPTKSSSCPAGRPRPRLRARSSTSTSGTTSPPC